MRNINCIFCGSEALVLGRSDQIVRKIKCSRCGIIGQVNKVQPIDIVVIRKQK